MNPNINVLRALPILFCIQLPICLFLTLPGTLNDQREKQLKGGNVWRLTDPVKGARGTYIVRVVQGRAVRIGKVIKK
jgi:hypothetical protein